MGLAGTVYRGFAALAVLSVLLVLAPTPARAQEEDQMDESPFYLAPGDAPAGREAFLAYRCASCHAVAGDLELPHPTAAVPAPVLKFGPKTPAHVIAQAIVAPSHTIAEGFGKGTPEEIQKSPMRDYNDVMTIRHLRDIVAYLKSLRTE